ncbi:MAG: hypothetical protein A2231_10835 [Candidatus Firestonebacteria bacterium RIFOXYA2_FULL_40_8]|nr:MAG: hypothetical protein A2231_10835 [Candidatus Firestonebacteria bacterium RIFOXYA2_FULL_40_8]
MFYLYILLNETNTRTYTGVTDNIERRLRQHNAGRVKSSKPYRPYRVFYTEVFETLSEAVQMETYYKTSAGRKKIKSLFNK